jgi:hypothetical protein
LRNLNVRGPELRRKSIHLGSRKFHHGWSSEALGEFVSMHVGSVIGNGAYRCVYEDLHDASCVIKVERRDRATFHFANVLEWEVWQALRGTAVGRLIAPCLDISHNGQVLIQKKTEPLDWKRDRAGLPKELPRCFTDLALRNWGRLGKKIVCHDYGNTLIGVGTDARRAAWRNE